MTVHPMRLTFSWPTNARFGGGIDALYQYANAMARRGHDVHIIHGPAAPERVNDVAEITWFTFEDSITHEILDDLEDTTFEGDVVFQPHAPARLGEPVTIVQGYKLLSTRFERVAFRTRCPRICVASWLIDIGVEWGSPAEQLMHVPVGIDPVFHEPVHQGPRPIDVVMLHTHHPSKGSTYGLEALELLRQRRPDTRAVVFGFDGHPDLVPDWIEHRTGPTRAEIRALLDETKVFLQPSRREGFGLTAVEAMARGCALVTTDNGGSRDYAFDHDSALLIPRDDAARTAHMLAELLDDDARRAALGGRGKEVTKRFDWDLVAETLEGHLLRYLEDPKRFQGEPADAPFGLDDDW